MFNRERQNLFVPFSDLGWGMAGVFIVITLILIMVIGKPHPEKQNSRSQGALIAEIYWDDNVDVDIDLWLLSPIDPIAVGYSRKNSKGWNLLVDDLGNATTMDKSGRNREFATTLSMETGHYIINAHYYRGNILPLTVKLIVTRNVKGSTQQLFVVTSVLGRECQEKTLIQFDIDGNGNLVKRSVHFTLHRLRSQNSCLTSNYPSNSGH